MTIHTYHVEYEAYVGQGRFAWAWAGLVAAETRADALDKGRRRVSLRYDHAHSEPVVRVYRKRPGEIVKEDS